MEISPEVQRVLHTRGCVPSALHLLGVCSHREGVGSLDYRRCGASSAPTILAVGVRTRWIKNAITGEVEPEWINRSPLARDKIPPKPLVHLIAALKHLEIRASVDDSIDPSVTSLDPKPPPSCPVS